MRMRLPDPEQGSARLCVETTHIRTLGGTNLHLIRATQPYDFALSLKRLLNHPRQVVARVEPGPVYVRALEHKGRTGLVLVRETGEGVAVALAGDLDPADTLNQVRQAFALDLDLAAFVAHMDAADPVMAALARQYSGARPIRPFDLWESLAWAIIGQQVNVTFAYALKDALVRLSGRSFAGYQAFPGPEAVANLRYEDLQAEKFTRKKAEYIIDLARALVQGKLDLQALVALPPKESLSALVKLRGVGVWTAECLRMDAGALDAFPADDIGIRNAVQRCYGLDRQPTAADVRALGASWAPYQALACFYLWLRLRDDG